jgi:hypothetical protein
MKTPHMVPHADLIDNWNFMCWCKNNKDLDNCDVVKWRGAYIAYVKGARTPLAASIKLGTSISNVFTLVGNYKRIAVQYKAELNEKI